MLIAAWWGGGAQGFVLKNLPGLEAEGRLETEISDLRGFIQAEKLLEPLCISQIQEAVRGRRQWGLMVPHEVAIGVALELIKQINLFSQMAKNRFFCVLVFLNKEAFPLSLASKSLAHSS